MVQPIPLAKLTRPEPSRVVVRSRLFLRLDEGRPLTWVGAPAGSGKTTLIGSYVAERKPHCLWYQMDEGDANPASFFHYLGLATQHAAGRHERPLPKLTPEYLLGIGTFARRFFEQLYARLESPAALVFDNYQEIPEDSPVHALLRVAVETLPAAVRLIVMSRTDPPAAFARLRLNGVLQTLAGQDLRLTVEEAIDLAALRQAATQRRSSRTEIEHLHAKVQGWTAGLVLLLEQPNPAEGDSGVLPDASQQLLFDYFAEEVFERCSPYQQAVLLETALLPWMTVPMAERLTGDRATGQVLADLLRRNFFIVQRVAGEPAYEYHPLFREFLLRRMGRRFPASELVSLQNRAAILLEENGQLEEAASLYQTTQDWEGMSRLASSQAQTLLTQGRNPTLLHWLNALPVAVLQNQPWLLYWRGTACLPFDPVEARGFLERAYAGFEEQDDPTGLYLTWAALVDTFNVEWHDYKPLDRWIAAFERLQARHPEFPSPEIELRVYAMLVAITYRQPQHPKLAVWAERALHLLHACAEPVPGMQLGAHLLHYHAWRGDLLKGRLVVDALQRLPPGSALTPFVRCLAHALRAVFCWVNGEPQASQEQVTQGLELARDTGMHIWDSLLYAQGVYGTLVAGDIRGAEAYLGDVASVTRMDASLQGGHYHFLAALVAQQRGEFGQGLDHALQSLAMTRDAGSPFPQAMSHSLVGLSLLQLGDDARADEHLRAARAFSEESGNGFIQYLVMLIEARTLFERGQQALGLDRLARALRLGREGGRYAVHWWGPVIMARLYAKALDAGIEVEYVQDVIRRTQLTPPDPATAPDHWPWPIKVYTLGRFSVIKGGEPLRFQGKAQKKPLELLQCLIALGGREVPEGQITDALWPDADGDAAYRALITMLQRLRQWLGYPEAVALSGAQLSLDPKWVWVDHWNFERLLSQAGDAGTDGSGATVPSRVEKALAIYRGPFLGQTDHPWAIARREKLRAKFIQHLLARGQALESEGLWEDASTCYLRGIEADGFVEAFHQQLIRCYQKQGRFAEARAAAGRWGRVSGVLE